MPTGPLPLRGMSQPLLNASQYSMSPSSTQPATMPLPLWLSSFFGSPGLFAATQYPIYRFLVRVCSSSPHVDMPAPPFSWTYTFVMRVFSSPLAYTPLRRKPLMSSESNLISRVRQSSTPEPSLPLLRPHPTNVKFDTTTWAQPRNWKPHPVPPWIKARPFPKEETLIGRS